MKAQNHFQEILALMPKNRLSAAIYESVAAIEAKALGWELGAAALRERREASLLSMTTDELRGLESDLDALVIAGKQARELAAAIRVLAVKRERWDCDKDFRAGSPRAAWLGNTFEDFEREFVILSETEMEEMIEAEAAAEVEGVLTGITPADSLEDMLMGLKY